MKSENILKIILISLLMIIVGLAVFVMPKMSEIMASDFPSYAYLKNPGLVIIYLSLLPLIHGGYCFWRLLDMSLGRVVFSREAINYLKKIRLDAIAIFVIYSMALLVLFVLEVPFSAAFLTIVMVCLSALALSVLMTIVKKLIIKAIEYREEIELTV